MYLQYQNFFQSCWIECKWTDADMTIDEWLSKFGNESDIQWIIFIFGESFRKILILGSYCIGHKLIDAELFICKFQYKYLTQLSFSENISFIWVYRNHFTYMSFLGNYLTHSSFFTQKIVHSIECSVQIFHSIEFSIKYFSKLSCSFRYFTQSSFSVNILLNLVF